MPNINWTKKRILIASACALLIVLLLIVAIVASSNRGDDYVYKESKVQYGVLTVGVTESGTVDIGTIEQSFDLDMSALKRVETSSSSSSSGFGSSGMGSSGGMAGFGGGMAPSGAMGATSGNGGQPGGSMNMFSQMLGGGSNLVGSGDDSSLVVKEVLVSVGQTVSEGDALFTLEGESVSKLEQELQSNVEKAKADLDAVYADQNLSKGTAKSTYEISLAYGDYAQSEYDFTIRSLQDSVNSSKATLDKTTNTLAEYQARLADITESYDDAVIALDNFEYALEHSDPLDVYGFIEKHQLVKQGKQQVQSLEQQKEQLEKNVEQAEQNVKTATQNYEKAKRNLDQGLLSAKETLALRQLAYRTAQETYDITLAYLEEDTKTQEEIYAETKEKWDEFSSYIGDNNVLSGYSGVITSVELKEGDSISTGTALITLYDLEDVTMTVSVYEEDMTDIAKGSLANISLTAYPNEMLTAKVSEISDASTDSKGNVIYDVTVTIEGDTSGLFQGMTGDITFVTEQSEETLYVLKRAVITDKNKSYVKVKEADGDIVKKQVTTGFSDGRYIQIVEGLMEGDTVLIESKVSK